jgi:UDP-N-acetylmuramoyl-L-alanyl-D-glutamate--2,6-diaminopimelate ligase
VNTTPESLDLQRLLRSMLTLGVEAVVMEVSSHGLELGRVTGCHFRVGAFTNLTQDHLDFHGSMDAYLASKARMFREHLAPGGAAVINVDDPAGEKLVAVAREAGAAIWRCTRNPRREAELRLLSADATLEGTRATLDWPGHGPLELELPLLGDFNLENLMVACGTAAALGVDPVAVAEGTVACPQVPGRMELVEPSRPVAGAPTVLVDYAHTPDAVDKLLQAVRPLARSRLVAVFGCGGDRDAQKRPLMAEAVARHADRAIATSDNPRTEDPDAILRDVEVGLAALTRVEPDAFGAARGAYCVLRDRREAIALAIASAAPDDTVVIAGKGHEDYQIIGREKLPFDDRIEARRALDARSSL